MFTCNYVVSVGEVSSSFYDTQEVGEERANLSAVVYL